MSGVSLPRARRHYTGPPIDDASAIKEVERLRAEAAAFLIVAWPAFWCLDFYVGLARPLTSGYRRVLDTDAS